MERPTTTSKATTPKRSVSLMNFMGGRKSSLGNKDKAKGPISVALSSVDDESTIVMPPAKATWKNMKKTKKVPKTTTRIKKESKVTKNDNDDPSVMSQPQTTTQPIHNRMVQQTPSSRDSITSSTTTTRTAAATPSKTTTKQHQGDTNQTTKQRVVDASNRHATNPSSVGASSTTKSVVQQKPSDKGTPTIHSNSSSSKMGARASKGTGASKEGRILSETVTRTADGKKRIVRRRVVKRSQSAMPTVTSSTPPRVQQQPPKSLPSSTVSATTVTKASTNPPTSTIVGKKTDLAVAAKSTTTAPLQSTTTKKTTSNVRAPINTPPKTPSKAAVEPPTTPRFANKSPVGSGKVTTPSSNPRPIKTTVLPSSNKDGSLAKPPTSKDTTMDDETATMASTLSGNFSSPLSYVEFSGLSDDSSASKPHKHRLETHHEEGHATSTAASHQPDDSRLSSIAKLLAVDLMSPDSTTVQIALEQMCGLCNEESNITAILTCGGQLSLIVVLRQWSTHTDIQAAGLSTLHKAAESLPFCTAATQLGAMDLVLCAMKNHMHSENVLTSGCGALLNLTVPADHAKQLVFAYGGIRTVCDACGSFPTNITLRKYALWIIQYMSYFGGDFNQRLVDDGGEEALVDMVECFSGKNEPILKSVIATLNRIQ